MTEHTPTQRSRRTRLGLLAFAVALILAIAGAVGLNHALGARNLESLEDTRSQLQIPDSWVLSEEKVSPPGLFGQTTCNFGATQCPQIQLTFEIPAPIANPDELEILLPGADWQEGDKTCIPRANLSSVSTTTCAADAHLNNTEVHVSAGGAVDDGEVTDPKVTVRIHNL